MWVGGHTHTYMLFYTELDLMYIFFIYLIVIKLKIFEIIIYITMLLQFISSITFVLLKVLLAYIHKGFHVQFVKFISTFTVAALWFYIVLGICGMLFLIVLSIMYCYCMQKKQQSSHNRLPNTSGIKVLRKNTETEICFI